MNWDQIAGRWKEIGTKAKMTWEHLTHESWRDKLKAKDRHVVPSKEEPQHVKHPEDMH
jgi:ABC-type Fe3+/spermidine/putrescine transport system ATPase subunit